VCSLGDAVRETEMRMTGGAMSEEKLGALEFAQSLYALLSLGDHVRLPHTFIAVVAEQVEAYTKARVRSERNAVIEKAAELADSTTSTCKSERGCCESVGAKIRALAE